MELHAPLALLGGLSASSFMRRHWQKKPLLVRQAVAPGQPWIDRNQLFEIASREGVESRLVQRQGPKAWALEHGPFKRTQLPPVKRGGWTLLVQGLDLHWQAAHDLLAQFDFMPRARLDDLMLSYATDGGGVGPHLDSYDVFLLQVQGRRRWRIGPPTQASLVPGLPLKILKQFEPTHDWVLEPGDMLYLPPSWAHDGVAEGECMTASVGFRASHGNELAAEMLQRLAEEVLDDEPSGLYADPRQVATAQPGLVPAALTAFAKQHVRNALRDPQGLARALGRALTEPKPRVVFHGFIASDLKAGVQLAAGTRMLYDANHLFVNGESYEASGQDARLLQQLADQRRLTPGQCHRLSAGAKACLMDWLDDGWLQPAGGSA
jgi:50S ribosomal protein L16 3-hydroxylase